MSNDQDTPTTNLNLESPYYLHSSDNSGQTLVSDVLTGLNNYNPWSLAMTMALKGKNKFCFVDGSFPSPASTHADYHHWSCVNNMVMSWILNSIDRSLAHTVLYAESAAAVWAYLKARFSSNTGPRIYELEKNIATFQQQDFSIAHYLNQLRSLWDELSFIDPPPKCTCQGCTCGAKETYISQQNKRRLMQFLMGLNDTFSQPQSQLLLTTSLPDVAHAYSLLLQDEAQKAHTHPPMTSEREALQTQTAHAFLAKQTPSRIRGTLMDSHLLHPLVLTNVMMLQKILYLHIRYNSFFAY